MKNNHLQKNKLIDRLGSTTIIESLSTFVTPARQERIEKVLQNRLNSIQLAIETPSDINNALAVIRSSEALGISTVHIIQPEGNVQFARQITQGAIYWCDVHFYVHLKDFLKKIQHENMGLAGATMNANTTVNTIPIQKPLCIILGNEHRGLSAEALTACQYHFKIAMYGMSESLNLSVAAGISLYDTTLRKRQLLQSNSDLSPQEYSKLKAQFFLNCVDRRLITNLFP